MKRSWWCALLFVALIAVASTAAAHADQSYIDAFQAAATRALGRHDNWLPVLLKRYGKPDAQTSTADDNPRPPIVTMFLDYTGVRVVLIANQREPPFTWSLMGFIYMPLNLPMPFSDGDARLKEGKTP